MKLYLLRILDGAKEVYGFSWLIFAFKVLADINITFNLIKFKNVYPKITFRTNDVMSFAMSPIERVSMSLQKKRLCLTLHLRNERSNSKCDWCLVRLLQYYTI